MPGVLATLMQELSPSHDSLSDQLVLFVRQLGTLQFLLRPEPFDYYAHLSRLLSYFKSVSDSNKPSKAILLCQFIPVTVVSKAVLHLGHKVLIVAQIHFRLDVGT